MAAESRTISPLRAARPSRGGIGLGRTTLGLALWRHKLFLCCVALCAVALTSVYVSQVPAVFEAEALVLLGEGEGGADLPDDVAVAAVAQGPASQAAAIRSEAMARRLVDTLGLHLLPEFNPTLQTGTSGMLGWLDPVGLVPNSVFNRLPATWRAALKSRDSVSDQEQAASLQDAIIAQARAHIAAEPTDRAAVIRVRFRSLDPRLAELGANTLVALYLADQLGAEQAVLSKAEAFLRGEIARLRERIADGVLESLIAQVTASDPAAGDAAAWDRALRADRDLLATYGARLAAIEAQMAAQIPRGRVISAATTPEDPVNRHQMPTFAMAVVVALLIGALAALGLERLDGTISSAEQLGALRLAMLGLLPAIPRTRDQRRALDRHILDYPDEPFGQAVAAMCDRLVRANALARRTTVLLTSTRADEGATTTALSLARCHARAGGTVLLIDCDLARPRLQALAGIAADDGLADVLREDRTLDQVLRRDERSGMRFVTAGARAAEASDQLGSDAMRALLQQAAADYDLVVLDGPPVLAGHDAPALAQVADGTALLARWGSTQRDDVIAAAELLIGAGADMAGLVLTCARPKKAVAEALGNAVPQPS